MSTRYTISPFIRFLPGDNRLSLFFDQLHSCFMTFTATKSGYGRQSDRHGDWCRWRSDFLSAGSWGISLYPCSLSNLWYWALYCILLSHRENLSFKLFSILTFWWRNFWIMTKFKKSPWLFTHRWVRHWCYSPSRHFTCLFIHPATQERHHKISLTSYNNLHSCILF